MGQRVSQCFPWDAVWNTYALARTLPWDSPVLGKPRRTPLFHVHVGIIPEAEGKTGAEVPSGEWSMSSRLLVNSTRAALPREQLPLGAPDVRSFLNPAMWLARQTASSALPSRTLKGDQRERQGWAPSQQPELLSLVGGNDDGNDAR